MFSPGHPEPRVTIGVVAYGETERLRRCVESLIAHQADVVFDVVCVVNPDSRSFPEPTAIPRDVMVLRPTTNLGWAGGLHLARSAVRGDYFVWAQDDMEVADGWLDALVGVADAHPEAGAVGSIEVDRASREPNGYAGGYAEPPDRVGLWNLTDVLRDGRSYDGQVLDWVTSKGLLTRTEAWDEIGGADPALFPLNHVDKEYSLHLRAHGWTLLLAREALLFHDKHQSGPGVLRAHLASWQEPGFDRTWGPVATSLGSGSSAAIPHACERIPTPSMADVEQIVGREASMMFVPIAASLAREIDAALRDRDGARRGLEQLRQTLSWRITAPLRRLKKVLRGGR